MIFITHDLGVVAQIADYVVVMYQGRILEIGSVHDVLKDPLHPYTKGLLAAIPGIAPPGQRLQTISSVVDPKELETPHPLVTLNNGRKVSLPNNQIRKGTQS
ncbi:MAG: hypothetical protein CM1200mP24_01800 [Gammaproteobacteria bacterium]|nr:MAG: hypothetical protein CM1200mP24_01800 [Gammaproteobacteria bacterium]